MGLQEELERLRTEVAESEKAEAEAAQAEEQETIPENEEETAPKPEEQEKEPEKPAEEAPEPEKKAESAEEEPKDNAAWQKMRRENAANKKRLADLEAKLAEKEQPAAEQEEAQAEELPLTPELKEIVHNHRLSRAEQEFRSMEAKYAATNPEYEAISSEYTMALAQSIRLQNPRLTALQIAEKTKEKLFQKAANFLKDGFDPIEELFHEAKDLGFTGQSFKAKEEPKVEKEEKPQPDMKKLAQNRARSTGMGAANGRSEGMLTKQGAADLTVAEWAKLPKEEKQRLLYG